MPTTFALYQFGLLSIIALQDDTSSDFGELGKELLGGFAIAVVVAVAYVFIKLRLGDKKEPEKFISITSFPSTDEQSKVGRK